MSAPTRPDDDPVIVAFREALRREVYPLWAKLRRAAGLSADPAEYARECEAARLIKSRGGT
ncbi:MAG TPA: hypothetical protein VMP67_06140 [Candidatus Limnocylindria bacterium]|nr:hypothetical protein [Candidatus Limnocylindria bacterium]